MWGGEAQFPAYIHDWKTADDRSKLHLHTHFPEDNRQKLRTQNQAHTRNLWEKSKITPPQNKLLFISHYLTIFYTWRNRDSTKVPNYPRHVNLGSLPKTDVSSLYALNPFVRFMTLVCDSLRANTLGTSLGPPRGASARRALWSHPSNLEGKMGVV